MSNIKSNLQSPNKVNSTFRDINSINTLYRLPHRELQKALLTMRNVILQQFDDFKQTLLASLKHLNYMRYIKTHPQDDIRFIFRQKDNPTALNEDKLEIKEQILKRMGVFNIIKEDNCGISENCLWQITRFLKQGKTLLNLTQICPSGVSYLDSNIQTIERYLPLWKNNDEKVSDLNSIFKQMSPSFPQGQIKKLGNIFSMANKSISSAKLIYRASQHNFQSSMFKQICFGRAPTLIIAKSDKDMVFGGFTPCKWLKTKQKQYVSDESGDSFLFSLHHEMIFPIKKNQLDYAISAYGGWGPIFGSPYGPDLSIADKCHQNDHSCSSLGSHYQIPPSIKQYSNEAFSLLAGAKKFKVLEYQVYEVFIA